MMQKFGVINSIVVFGLSPAIVRAISQDSYYLFKRFVEGLK
jgi:hypothetical protein